MTKKKTEKEMREAKGKKKGVTKAETNNEIKKKQSKIEVVMEENADDTKGKKSRNNAKTR